MPRPKSTQTLAANILHTIWWLLVLRAAVLFAFALLALFWPGLTLLGFVYIFAGYLIATGVLNIISGSMGNQSRGRFLTILIGVAEVLVAVLMIKNLLLSLEAIILVIGVLFIARGVMELVTAVVDRSSRERRIFLVLGGLLALAAGVFVILQPATGGLAFVWALGLYALLSGSISLVVGVQTRGLVEAKAS